MICGPNEGIINKYLSNIYLPNDNRKPESDPKLRILWNYASLNERYATLTELRLCTMADQKEHHHTSKTVNLSWSQPEVGWFQDRWKVLNAKSSTQSDKEQNHSFLQGP